VPIKGGIGTGMSMVLSKWKMTLARRFSEKGSCGWWQLKAFFMFIPKIGEDEPILTNIFFKWVGKNHQLVVSGAQKRW